MRTPVLAMMLLVASEAALAHPMGRASVNQSLTLTVGAPDMGLALAQDFAETLTAREMTRLDPDKDGQVSKAEEAAYVALLGREVQGALTVQANGHAVRLAPAGGTVQFFNGEQGFPTAIVTLLYRASAARWLAAGANRVEVSNQAWWNTPGQCRVRAVPADDLPAGAAVASLPPPEGSNPLVLRDLGADLTLPAGWTAPPSPPGGEQDPATAPDAPTTTIAAPGPDENPILTALRARDLGPWALLAALGLAFFFGMVHSLSPGHGKTLAAAFLLGRRARARHAVWLGLVVTLAHVVGVVALGVVSVLVAGLFDAERTSALVSAGSGAVIFVLGLGMLTRRPHGHDHHHAPHDHGHDHDHPHDHAHDHDHDHDHDHGHDHAHSPHHPPATAAGEPTLREILALGFSGGVAPCPTALVILLLAIAVGRVGFGLALIVAFSLGLAVVLVVGGLAVVRLGDAVLARAPGLERFHPWLSRASALVITLIGAALAVQGLIAAGVVTLHL